MTVLLSTYNICLNLYSQFYAEIICLSGPMSTDTTAPKLLNFSPLHPAQLNRLQINNCLLNLNNEK